MLQYDQAVALPAGFENDALLAELNRILVGLKESGDMEQLISEYVTPESNCKRSGVYEVNTQIKFSNLAGLWIMLGGAVALALLIFLGGQLALCGARRVASTKTYQRSMHKLQTVGSRQMSTLRTLKRRSSSLLTGGRRASSRLDGSRGKLPPLAEEDGG